MRDTLLKHWLSESYWHYAFSNSTSQIGAYYIFVDVIYY